MISQHPDVYLSPFKEPYFFELEYELGFQYYHTRYFPNRSDKHKFWIDARHRNMFLPYVPYRLYQYNPDAKIIVLVREPVKRAFSHWWMWYVRGLEKLPFHAAIAEDMERIERYPDILEPPLGEMIWARYFWYRYGKNRVLRTYVDSGFYCKQLRRILEFFSAEQLLILVSENFRRDPLATLRRCEEFLGLSPYSYAGIVQENISLGKSGTKLYDLARWLARRWRILSTRHVSQAARLLSRFSRPPKPDQYTEKLLREVYAGEVRCLQKQFGLDLSSWGYSSNE